MFESVRCCFWICMIQVCFSRFSIWDMISQICCWIWICFQIYLWFSDCMLDVCFVVHRLFGWIYLWICSILTDEIVGWFLCFFFLYQFGVLFLINHQLELLFVVGVVMVPSCCNCKTFRGCWWSCVGWGIESCNWWFFGVKLLLSYIGELEVVIWFVWWSWLYSMLVNVLRQQGFTIICSSSSNWFAYAQDGVISSETSLMWLILLLNFMVFDCGPKYIKHHWTTGLWDWISWITDSQSIYFSCHKQRCLGIDSLGYDIHWSCAPSTIFKKVWRKKLKAWNGFSPAAHDDLKGELE